MEEKDYLIWLNHIRGVGNKTLDKLIRYFGNAENVFKASSEKIYQFKGINHDLAHNIVQNRNSLDIQELMKNIKKQNIDIICKEDDEYPENLKNIYDPPFILYKRGHIIERDKNAIAIVGSRKATGYGKWVAYKLASELAQRGITIISGMAYGIDTAAHQGALDVGGRTFAVLGCGLDICYPKPNYNLMLKIAQKGALLSEYSLGTKPLPGNFPARNRIISGIAKGVIVVEAGIDSGSLITVEFALEQGREIFAVPGNINNPLSVGTNQLIQEGAKLVTDIEDVLEELDIEIIHKNQEQEKNSIELSALEEQIYEIIYYRQPIPMDVLYKEIKVNVSHLNGIITILELKGLIQQLPGKILIVK